MVLNYCAGGTLKDMTHWFYKPTPMRLNENQASQNGAMPPSFTYS